MPFGLYLHFPFCRNRCAYCNFYKELHDVALERRFYDALKIETEMAVTACPEDSCEITSIYIGGGTPSLTDPELFGDWLEQVRRLFRISESVEFSFECNPESVTRELLQELQGYGMNRPVFGIQSFHRGLLRLLEREHDVRDSHQSVYFANVLWFENFGADLIFGLPAQTGKMLSTDLDELTDLEPPHVSFYQLTIESGTSLAEQIRDGLLRTPDEDLMFAFYRAGSEHLMEKGYVRYEVSSFAKPGYECRHNLGCWEGDDYLGLGPSAHSFLDGCRFANARSLTEYLERLQGGKRPVVNDSSGVEERMIETIMLGLHTSRGVNRKRFAGRFGRDVEECLNSDQYAMLIESGHLVTEGDTLRLSDNGIYLADEIARRLIK